MSDSFIPIVEVDYALANRFNDRIEINRYLKKYPELYHQILQHEMEHTDSTFSKKDLLLDLTGTKINYWTLLKFMVGHPRSFYQLSPVIISKRGDVSKIVYDINQIIIYFILLCAIGTGVYIAFHI
jgi:hypothetical protein